MAAENFITRATSAHGPADMLQQFAHVRYRRRQRRLELKAIRMITRAPVLKGVVDLHAAINRFVADHKGRYSLAKLIEKHGRKGNMTA